MKNKEELKSGSWTNSDFLVRVSLAHPWPTSFVNVPALDDAFLRALCFLVTLPPIPVLSESPCDFLSPSPSPCMVVFSFVYLQPTQS